MHYPVGRPTLYPIGRPVRATITLYPIGRPVRTTVTLFPIGRPVRATITLYPIGIAIVFNLQAASNTKNLDVGANAFIGNLDPEIDEKMLYDTFSAFGVILQTPKVSHVCNFYCIKF